MSNVSPDNELCLQKLTYASSDHAAKVYSELGSKSREQMAEVYQKTFAGPPWFEVWACASCRNYSKDKGGECPKCNSQDYHEAYPVFEKVRQSYLRRTFSVLLLAQRYL